MHHTSNTKTHERNQVMKTATQIKVPEDPQRILTMPRQFGSLDRRLVYEKHIRFMSSEQNALSELLISIDA